MEKSAIIAVIIIIIISAFAFLNDNPSLMIKDRRNVTDLHDCILKNFGLGNSCSLEMEKTDKVLIIGISGMGFDTYTDYYPETLARISERGVVYRADGVHPDSDYLAYPTILSGDGTTQVQKVLEDDGHKVVTVSSYSFLKSVYIEGNVLYSDTDWNRNGVVGDNYDIGKGASQVIREYGPDFAFVVFNLDTVAHNYGPVSEQTKDEMLVIDDAVLEILSELDGTWNVIIISDHGLHACKKMTVGGIKNGCHGDDPGDSVVPLIIAQSKDLFN